MHKQVKVRQHVGETAEAILCLTEVKGEGHQRG